MVIGCLTLVFAATFGFVAGRKFEEGSQLGRALTLQPKIAALDSALVAAKAWERYLTRMPQKRAPVPLGAHQAPAAPTIQPAHQPEPRP